MTKDDDTMETSTDMAPIWREHSREGFFVSEDMVEQVARYIEQQARVGKTTTKQGIMQAFSYSLMAVTEAVNILIAEGTVCLIPSPTTRAGSSSPDDPHGRLTSPLSS